MYIEFKVCRITDLSIVLIDAFTLSEALSANRESCELPGLVSALRGRFVAIDRCDDGNVPDAEDGREFGPQALGEPSDSLPAVDGLEPPPEEGRPLKWLDELELPSFLADRIDEEAHAFGVVDGALLPHVRVPLTLKSKISWQSNYAKTLRSS